jgi:hypothetical protein
MNNSDLKLAATVVQDDVPVNHFDVQEHTMSSGSNNAPAVAWQQKGLAADSAHLLGVQAFYQRFHCCFISSIFCVPSIVNVMADDASRLFKLSDISLLTHFNIVCSQMISWRSLQPTPCTGSESSQQHCSFGLRANSNNKTWLVWPQQCCGDLHIDPWLSDAENPILLQQVFGQRCPNGHLTPSVKPCQVSHSGRSPACSGADIRKRGVPPRTSGSHQFCLHQQLTAYAQANPPPNCVKPIPIAVICHLIVQANAQDSIDLLAIADMVSHAPR